LPDCSQDFLNGVCTNVIHMHKKTLNYYSGNYDQYVQTRAEQEENQMKRYRWEQEQISHMKVGALGHHDRQKRGSVAGGRRLQCMFGAVSECLLCSGVWRVC
jgi:ATPase subunit of ABC transporter with duplicated ATPase domains